MVPTSGSAAADSIMRRPGAFDGGTTGRPLRKSVIGKVGTPEVEAGRKLVAPAPRVNCQIVIFFLFRQGLARCITNL